MIVVKKRRGESDDRLISRFKKEIVKEKILDEVREKERYVKPSEKKKEKKYQKEHLISLEKKRMY